MWLFMVLAFEITIFQISLFQPTLKLDSIKIYDKYDQELGLIYDEGHISITCEAPKPYVCKPRYVFQLLDPYGKVVVEERCKDDTPSVEFRLNITKNTNFGEYRCRREYETSNESFAINYRMCNDREALCSKQTLVCERAKYYCVHRLDTVYTDSIETDPCAQWFPLEYCTPQTNLVYCPGEARSLCEVKSQMRHTAIRAQVAGNTCSLRDSDNYPSLTYDGKRFEFYDHFQITETHKRVSVKYENETILSLHKLNLTCGVKRRNGEIVDKILLGNSRIGDNWYNFGNAVFSNGPNIFILECVFKNNSAIMVKLLNYVVVLGGSLSICATYNRDQSRIQRLQCQLDQLPTVDFPLTLSYWWTSNSSGKEIILNGSNMNNPSQGSSYQCHCLVHYRTCRAHEKFLSTLTSDPFQVPLDTNKALARNGLTLPQSRASKIGDNVQILCGVGSALVIMKVYLAK